MHQPRARRVLRRRRGCQRWVVPAAAPRGRDPGTIRGTQDTPDHLLRLRWGRLGFFVPAAVRCVVCGAGLRGRDPGTTFGTQDTPGRLLRRRWGRQRCVVPAAAPRGSRRCDGPAALPGAAPPPAPAQMTCIFVTRVLEATWMRAFPCVGLIVLRGYLLIRAWDPLSEFPSAV